ncbi:hypothetical protein N0V90_006375 [Kalmusia sp. IMI 367209]|nr:hypothetical protein N0V90_006375 [Kalmusia sp. IMI 367209]
MEPSSQSPRDPLESMTPKAKGDISAELQARLQHNMQADAQITDRNSLNTQAVEESQEAYDEDPNERTQDLEHEKVSDTSLTTRTSSYASLHLHDLPPPALPQTLNTFRVERNTSVQDEPRAESSSTPVRLDDTTAEGFQGTRPSMLQSSFALRYSPPNASAVSSSVTSPVTPTFSRPRHRTVFPGPILGSSASDRPPQLRTSYVESYLDDGEGEGEGEVVENEAAGTTMTFDPDHDDAYDVMNCPYQGEHGFVVPHVDGINSADGSQLDMILQDEQERSPESSFTKTLKYFKQFKGKENSPSKARRNASLPEEIAELAKEAQQEDMDEDHEMWARYRDIDLAPLDPVLEDGMAGDLIMAGTPMGRNVQARMEEGRTPWFLAADEEQGAAQETPTRKGIGAWVGGEDSSTASHRASSADVAADGEPEQEEGNVYEVCIPGHFCDFFKMRIRTKGSPEDIASFIRKRSESLEASQEAIEQSVKDFLASPETFIVPETHDEDDQLAEVDSACEKQLFSCRDDPVFVRVLGLLPRAMFWAVAQPVAHYASRALDTAVERLTSMSLD